MGLGTGHSKRPNRQFLLDIGRFSGRQVGENRGGPGAVGGELHPIQDAFVKTGAIQCGFCTSGMEMASLHLLKHNPSPTEMEIRAGLSGHLCRCTGYNQIVEAVSVAAETMKNRQSEEVE